MNSRQRMVRYRLVSKDSRDVSHLAACPGFRLAVEVQVRARLGQDLLPGIGIVPDQVLHLDPTETSGIAQWPAADRPHMLLELRGRGAAERPMAGIVYPRGDLVDHETLDAVLGDQKQL